MAAISDRVWETTVTSGTGSVTLAGAYSTDYIRFQTANSVGDLIYYVIENPGLGQWEVGIGTLTSTTVLARTIVLASSNAGALVNFTGEVKNVWIDAPATTLGGSPTNYMLGFPAQSGPGSSNVTIGYANKNGLASRCRDIADVMDITLAVGTTLVPSNTAVSGPLGDDGFTGPGTVTCGASTSITGNSTTFLSSFGKRAATGTYSTLGTTATGVGTLFKSELVLNDLIGDDTNGYSRVTAIASDTSCTLSFALPNGNAGAGTSFNIIEQPTIKISTNAITQVDKIAANSGVGAITTVTSQISQTTVTYDIGHILTISAATASFFQFVWLGKGVTGTTAFFSTQRTKPYGYRDFGVAMTTSALNGYLSGVRRICECLGSGVFSTFRQDGIGNRRRYILLQGSTLVLNNGNATSSTTVVCNNAASPFADILWVLGYINGTLTTYTLSIFHPNGSSGSGLQVSCSGTSSVAGFATGTGPVPCDTLQNINYNNNVSSQSFSRIYIFGWESNI